MKNIKLLVLAITLISVIGCEDAYRIDQPGRIPADEAFLTVEDLELGLISSYGRLSTTPEIAFSTYFTDEGAIGTQNGGQALGLYAFQLTPASEASATFWVSNYATINSVNRIIEGAESIETEDQAALNNLLAQARAIRAYAHFELLMYYSTDLTDDNALGVTRMDFVPDITQTFLRNTNGEVFDLITDDLNFAATNITDVDSRYFFSQNSVKALQARIAAFRGQYDTVENLALDLTSSYPLADTLNYKRMFITESDTIDLVRGETIFALQRVVGDNYDQQGATGAVGGAGYVGAKFVFSGVAADPYIEMGRSLFNLYDRDGVRFEVNLNEESVIDENFPGPDYDAVREILYIGKYPGKDDQPLMADLQVFRASDIHLLLAEAYAVQGNLNGASNSVASLIQELRDVRDVNGGSNPLPEYASTQEALQDILLERRLEFAYEGHRYRDLKRLGVQAGVGIDKADTDCLPFGGGCELPASDFRFTLPLPIVEFNANPDLREQQNPGY
jgi:hypothetical protein